MNDTPKSSPGGVIAGWWRDRIAAETGTARKTRAELKRASSPAEVLTVTAVHELNARLRDANDGWDLRNRPKTLALIAATLAGVETDDRLSLPRKFGKGSNERQVLSELRFQRIISAGDQWTLAIRLRRALPAAGKSCNAAKLGNDLFYWGDDVRSRWCFEYFDPRQLEEPGNSDTAETMQTEDA